MGNDPIRPISLGYKLAGFMRETPDDFDSDHDFRIRECVLTNEKLTMDWEEEGDKYHARLFSSDGIVYRGTFGVPMLNEDCRMEAVRHQFNENTVLLATWSRKDTRSGLISSLSSVNPFCIKAGYNINAKHGFRWMGSWVAPSVAVHPSFHIAQDTRQPFLINYGFSCSCAPSDTFSE